MDTYVILTTLSSKSYRDSDQFRSVAERVAQRIREECPKVKWKESYALMGRFDIVDIVEAEDPSEVEKAALIIRSEADATTETMYATAWDEFLKSL